MKITPTQYNAPTAVNQTSATEQTRTQAAVDLSIERSRPVAPAVGEAQMQIAALEEVDMEKVAAMKEIISAGKIDINLDKLTRAMQKFYQR